jgi:tetratricopeptide (TPR) repeat protein
MKIYKLTTYCALLFTATSFAADRITLTEGRPLAGTIVNVTAEKVSIETNSKTEEIDANKIVTIIYDHEPTGLNTVRTAIRNNQMTEALEALNKIDITKLPNNPYMKQEYAYLMAYIKSQLALTTSADPKEAETLLITFLQQNKKSYHYYEICQIYGKLLSMEGKSALAKKAYEQLAKAPWEEYNLTAKIELGNAAITENKTEEARQLFEEVANIQTVSQTAEDQKALAKVGIAKCNIAENKLEEAIKQLETYIATTNPENTPLQATLYTTLGKAYEKANKPQYAINAYLSVDILYSNARAEHITALKSLQNLWQKTGRKDRAEETEKRLKELYKISVEK